MANQTDSIMCMINGVSIDVHIIEVDLYSGDQKKAFTFRIAGGITMEGVKTSKIRSVGPEGVHYHRVITLEGCSLTEVLLYLLWH